MAIHGYRPAGFAASAPSLAMGSLFNGAPHLEWRYKWAKLLEIPTPLMSPAIMGSSILLGIKEAGDMLAI